MLPYLIAIVNMAHCQDVVNREFSYFFYRGIYLCGNDLFVYFNFNNFSSNVKMFD